MIEFQPQQSEISCPVTIIDDSLKEDAEQFHVVLTMAMGGKLGRRNETTVIIDADEKDGKFGVRVEWLVYGFPLSCIVWALWLSPVYMVTGPRLLLSKNYFISFSIYRTWNFPIYYMFI